MRDLEWDLAECTFSEALLQTVQITLCFSTVWTTQDIPGQLVPSELKSQVKISIEDLLREKVKRTNKKLKTVTFMKFTPSPSATEEYVT